jgi:hypothetical protein
MLERELRSGDAVGRLLDLVASIAQARRKDAANGAAVIDEEHTRHASRDLRTP